ncbi:hypothetical protein COW98_02705, partial [Candidatus Roizmanbacteria bacterium CG22_combo_CG10-13_8_21_14_all_35_9]
KRKLLCGVLLSTSRTAGLRFGSGEAEFPPHPPSASPSLGLAFFRRNLRACQFYWCAARLLILTNPL